MTAIELAREVVATCGARLARPRKDAPGQYDAKPYFTGSKRGWVLLDLFTASTIVQVHDALNETNRAKFAALDLSRMASVAFRLVEGARS